MGFVLKSIRIKLTSNFDKYIGSFSTKKNIYTRKTFNSQNGSDDDKAGLSLFVKCVDNILFYLFYKKVTSKSFNLRTECCLNIK